MKVRTILLSFILVCLMIGGVALAGGMSAPNSKLDVAEENDVFTLDKAGIQFKAPKGWNVENEGDVITITSPDNALTVLIWASNSATFKDAVKGATGELKQTVSNIRVTNDGETDTHNGMPHYSISGTGEVKGSKALWSLDLLYAKKPFLVLSYTLTDKMDKYAKEYMAMVNSIKKVE